MKLMNQFLTTFKYINTRKRSVSSQRMYEVFEENDSDYTIISVIKRL